MRGHIKCDAFGTLLLQRNKEAEPDNKLTQMDQGKNGTMTFFLLKHVHKN